MKKRYFRTNKSYINFVNSYEGEIKKVYITRKFVVVCL